MTIIMQCTCVSFLAIKKQQLDVEEEGVILSEKLVAVEKEKAMSESLMMPSSAVMSTSTAMPASRRRLLAPSKKKKREVQGVYSLSLTLYIYM